MRPTAAAAPKVTLQLQAQSATVATPPPPIPVATRSKQTYQHPHPRQHQILPVLLTKSHHTFTMACKRLRVINACNVKCQLAQEKRVEITPPAVRPRWFRGGLLCHVRAVASTTSPM